MPFVRDALRRLFGLDADRRALDAGQLRLGQRLDDLNDSHGRLARLEKEVAEGSGELLAEIAHSRAGLLAEIAEGQRGASAEIAGRLALIERRLEALETAQQQDPKADTALRLLDELRNHVRFLEYAACRAPVYVQPGLNAIITFSGWEEPPIVVPTTHIGVLNTYQRRGVWDTERGVRTVIERELKAGDVAVDIGAHVGIHAVVMGRIVGPEGRLHCFEPDPDLAAALRQTFVMNGFPQAVVVNAAVADAPGRREFFRTAHSAESSLFEALPTAVARDHIPVDVVSLDAIFPPGARVDFIKMDAEGAEAAILRGMKRVLADNPQLRIIMEFAPIHFERAGEDAVAFVEGLERSGFSIAAIDDKSGETSPVSKTELLNGYSFNLWLTRKS